MEPFVSDFVGCRNSNSNSNRELVTKSSRFGHFVLTLCTSQDSFTASVNCKWLVLFHQRRSINENIFRFSKWQTNTGFLDKAFLLLAKSLVAFEISFAPIAKDVWNLKWNMLKVMEHFIKSSIYRLPSGVESGTKDKAVV